MTRDVTAQDSSADRVMASRLCEYLMKHCHHDDRRVLKNNLEVLKTLVEVWRSRVHVPTKYDVINYSNFDSHLYVHIHAHVDVLVHVEQFALPCSTLMISARAQLTVVTRVFTSTCRVLFDNFTADKDSKSKRSATGIQMVGVVLANKLQPWRSEQGVDRDRCAVTS